MTYDRETEFREYLLDIIQKNKDRLMTWKNARFMARENPKRYELRLSQYFNWVRLIDLKLEKRYKDYQIKDMYTVFKFNWNLNKTKAWSDYGS